MNEPPVTINGRLLSEGQALTLRMALGCLKLDLHQESAERKFGSRQIAQHLRSLEELTELIGRLNT